MNRHTALARTLLASAAIAVAIALGGCETDGLNPAVTARAMKPLSNEMLALLEQKNMPKDSPILVRIFKEEAEMEIWKQDTSGQFALLKTFPICRWSGELGPKIKEGDRQAPEGFYTITPGQMNPNSNYYLSFNLGFPNAFDKANDRTGAFLMVHGDCSSAGCYAMTDEQMGEIYALGRESFFGGQKSFQVQAYPFRMTPLNLAKHRNNPSMAFWRMIKQGNDHFEVTRQQPKVDVCDKHYVFDAGAPTGSTAPLNFNPRGKCPAYEVPEEIAAAVKGKHDQDEREFATLVARGTATVAIKTGADGGMHPTFLAKLRPREQFDADGRVRVVESTTPALPPNVNPPRVAEPEVTATARPASQSSVRVATTEASPPGASGAGNMFNNLFSSNGDTAKPAEKSDGALDKVGSTVKGWFGVRNEPESPPAAKPQQSRQPVALPKPAPGRRVLAAAPGALRPTQPAERQAHVQAQKPPAHVTHAPQSAQTPQVAQAAPQDAQAPQSAAPTTSAGFASATGAAPTVGMMAGAQPVMPVGTFESRWGGIR